MFDSFYIEKSQEFELLLTGLTNVVIIVHYNPDGDAVGSAVALSCFLKSLGKRVIIISPNSIPDNLKFVYNKEEVLIYDADSARCEEIIDGSDLLIFVDQSSITRTEIMSDFLKSVEKKKMVIDHHPNTNWDDFFWGATNVDLSSTCELLFNLIINSKYIGNEIYRIPLPCAQALYTGMITDTNNFSNSLYPSTLMMASRLLERGIDRDMINKYLYQNFSEERMRFMGFALYDRMVVRRDIGVAYIVLKRSDLGRFNFIKGDTEGFVNLPLSIDEVEVSALFTERDGHVRVSLRSVGEISVNELSRQYFNGGGHEKAAGGKLFIPIEEVGEYFENSVESYIKGTSFVKQDKDE